MPRSDQQSEDESDSDEKPADLATSMDNPYLNRRSAGLHVSP